MPPLIGAFQMRVTLLTLLTLTLACRWEGDGSWTGGL